MSDSRFNVSPVFPNLWKGHAIVVRCAQDSDTKRLILYPSMNPSIHTTNASAHREACALADRHKNSFAVLSIGAIVVNTPLPKKTYRVALMASTDPKEEHRKLKTCYSVEDEIETSKNPLFRKWATERQIVEVDA